MCKKSFAVTLSSLIAWLCAAYASGGIVDFQNFSQQFIHGSFTDPVSGVFFSNAQASGGEFGIQDSSAAHYAGTPTFMPTIYLTGNGLSLPNTSFSTNGNFGFDASLPGSFQSILVAILYSTSTGGTITLSGFDSSSNLVASSTDNLSPPNPTFAETSISISAATASIARFSIRASGVSTGYDNIVFTVPEPSTIALLTTGALGLLWAGRNRSNAH